MELLAVIVLASTLSAPIECRMLGDVNEYLRTEDDNTATPERTAVVDHTRLADRTAIVERIGLADRTSVDDHKDVTAYTSLSDRTATNEPTVADHTNIDDHSKNHHTDSNYSSDRTSASNHGVTHHIGHHDRTASHHIGLADQTSKNDGIGSNDRSSANDRSLHDRTAGHEMTLTNRTAINDNKNIAERDGIIDHDLKVTAKASDHNKAHVTADEDLQPARYGLLPTPNIASPALDTLVLPSKYPYREPNVLYTRRINSEEVDRSPHKHRRKIKIHNDGSLWTKFPHMKHLVEIVPIKHKSKSKALAYIVPKSHSVKKKFNKHRVIPGIVVNRNLPDLSEVYESSEEDSIIDSSYSKSSESESMESNSSYNDETMSTESQSREAEDTDTSSKHALFDHDNIENEINSKLNDIVNYYNVNQNSDLNNLVLDVIPIDESDPNNHVHYIKHNRYVPNHDHHTDDNKAHDINNVIHINHEPDQDEKIHNQMFGHNEYHHEHKTYPGNANYHHSFKINEDGVDYNLVHSYDEGRHTAYASAVTPQLGQSSTIDIDTDNVKNHLENLRDLIHKENMGHGLNPLLEVSARVENHSDHEEKNEDINDSLPYDEDKKLDFYGNNFEETPTEQYSDSTSEENSTDSEFSEDLSSAVSDSVDISAIHSNSEETNKHMHRRSQEINHHFIDTIGSEPVSYHYISTIDSEELASHENYSNLSSIQDESNDPTFDSSESLEHDKDISLTNMARHDFLFPDCKKTKKKITRKCGNDCERQRSYSLTFLFNR